MSPRAQLLSAACVALAAAAQPCGATCTVSAVGLAFGNYDGLRVAPTDSIGSVAVTCIARRGAFFPYSIALSAGGGTFGARSMRSGSGYTLNYNLYLGADRSVVWGDGNGGTGVLQDAQSLDRVNMTRNYPVYGRMPSRQHLPPGVYTDSIVVTLDF